MSLLVRKIDKSKWSQNNIIEGEDVSADAITNDMKTHNNTLSFWQIDSETEINEVILAIVSGGQHLEAIDIVTIDNQQIRGDGINFIPNPENAITPVEELKHRHRDLIELSYLKLGTIACYIVDCFKNGQVVRYTKGHLKEILIDAIDRDHLDPDCLDEHIREALK